MPKSREECRGDYYVTARSRVVAYKMSCIFFSSSLSLIKKRKKRKRKEKRKKERMKTREENKSFARILRIDLVRFRRLNMLFQSVFVE